MATTEWLSEEKSTRGGKKMISPVQRTFSGATMVAVDGGENNLVRTSMPDTPQNLENDVCTHLSSRIGAYVL